MTVPSLGIFQYAGVTFPTETSTTVTARPKYDDSDRQATYIIHQINASCTVTAACLIDSLPGAGGPNSVSGDFCDDVLAYIRIRLTTPGSNLIFEGMGYSSLSCNGDSQALDVDFGPKPRLITWRPISNIAAEITWQCDVALPECFGVQYQGVLLSLNYTQDFNIDHIGNCSRSTTGVYTIPMTRQQNGTLLGPSTLPDSADLYWDQVFARFSVPYWCRRTTNQRYLDYSKRSLRFRLVDTQMGQNMLPPYVSEMHASQSVTPLRKPGQQSIIGRYLLTFNASITLVRNVARSNVYQVFLDWVKTRINFALQAGFTMLPFSVSLEEPDVFGTGPTGRFSLSFIMLQPLTSNNANKWLSGTGMWLSTDYTWEDWYATMIDGGVNTPYGSAQLRAIASDDELVNSCSQPNGVYGSQFVYIDVPFGGITARFPVIKPSAQTSWLTYENKQTMETDSGTVKHKLLPDGMQKDPNSGSGGNFADNTVGTAAGRLVGSFINANNTDVVQNVKSPNIKLRLQGSATRVTFDIPAPIIKTLNGDTLQPADNPQYATEQIGNFGYPLFRATWDIVYDIPYSDFVNSYVLNSPDSPIPGQDTDDEDDSGDSLQGDGINDGGETTDIYEIKGNGN